MHCLGKIQSVAWLVKCVFYAPHVREMGLVQPAVKVVSHHWEILGQSSLVFSASKFISPLISNTC
jgi:hypothetical protein